MLTTLTFVGIVRIWWLEVKQGVEQKYTKKVKTKNSYIYLF